MYNFQLRGDTKTADQNNTFRFRCLLRHFDGSSNDTCKKLENFVSKPHEFCDEFERITGGIVKHKRKAESDEAVLQVAKKARMDNERLL